MPDSTPSKVCSKCGDAKPLEAFNRQSRSKDGRHYYCRECQHEYAAKNRERATALARQRYASMGGDNRAVANAAAWRKRNAEHIKAYKREYRTLNAPAIREYDRAYRAANAEQTLAIARANASRWRAKYPDKARIKDARRRAMKLAAFLEDVEISVLYERDGGTCYVCGADIDPALKYPNRMSMSLEHVIPLARGGEHSYANCSISHLSCNASKGAKV